MQLIPSLDLRGGRVVRLRHGDPDRMTTYDLEPEAWVERLVRAGARRIHLVDLDGAFGEPRQPLFRRIPRRWPEVRFQLGGGLRTRGAVEDALAEGFDAVVGTLAVERPAELAGLPPGRVVLALDLKAGRLCVRGWQSLADCADAEVFEALRSLGFDQALVTDVGRDGTLEGPGLEAIRRVAREGFRVQASGGLRDLADLQCLASEPGVTGAIVGRALLEGRLDLSDHGLRPFLGGV